MFFWVPPARLHGDEIEQTYRRLASGVPTAINSPAGPFGFGVSDTGFMRRCCIWFSSALSRHKAQDHHKLQKTSSSHITGSVSKLSGILMRASSCEGPRWYAQLSTSRA